MTSTSRRGTKLLGIFPEIKLDDIDSIFRFDKEEIEGKEEFKILLSNERYCNDTRNLIS